MKNFPLFLLGFLCVFLYNNINASNNNALDAIQAASSISGTVFSDNNEDGVQDSNEGGIVDITITLISPDGTIETTLTNSDGNFSFGGLQAGTYTVTIGNGPEGSMLTTPGTDTVDLGDDENYIDANFGFAGSTSDLSLTKVADADVVAVGDVITYTITLSNAGPLAATGVQVFDPIPAGLTIQNSFASTGIYSAFTGIWFIGDVAVGVDETLSIEVIASESGDFCNIAQVSSADQPDFDSQPNNDDGDQSEDDEDNACVTVQELSSIEGYVQIVSCNDTTGIPGVPVTLTDADGNTQTTSTDNDGYYTFDNLPPGDYTITVGEGPSGAINTAGTYTISLGPGENYTDADFGFNDSPEYNSLIGNFEYNPNCSSSTEPISGVVITLTSTNGISYSTEINNGTYQFDDILTGIYTISITNFDTENYVFYIEGNTNTIILAGEETDNINFTICEIDFDDCSFNNRYFSIKCGSILNINGPDLSTNESYNWYEYPDTNTIVHIGNNLIVENNDNAAFKKYKAIYNLNDVPDTSCYGEYVIEYFSANSINGITFLDTNQDGEYNIDETPKEGVEIYLFDKNNNVTNTTTTGTDGSYSFSCLPDGVYIVSSDISTDFLTTPEFSIVSTTNSSPNTVSFGCIDTGDLAGFSNNSTIELPCDSILTLTAPYYKENDTYINSYRWYDQAEPLTVLYEGDKFTVPININSTVTYEAKRTTNEQENPSIYTITYLPCEDKCPCEFDVIDYVVCNSPEEYEVVISLDQKREMMIIDNINTDIEIGPVETMIISLGPFDTPNGFSYDIDFLKENCKKTISKTFVDCQFTAVELLRFDGQIASNGNLIEWATATENDIDAFILEYSKDGYNFEKITEINTIGNSNTTRTYNQLHQITKSGKHYYKLSTKDHSGNIQSVSRIIEIERMGDLIELHLYPNPISDVLNLEIINAKEKEIDIQIYNYLGELILQQNLVINTESNIRSIQTNELISGSYFIKISTNDVLIIQKFIKN